MNEPRFTDKNGREYTVIFDFPRAIAIKKKCNLDFTDKKAFGSNWLKLYEDGYTALAVLWEAIDKGPDANFDDFCRVMDGERLDAARDALFAAIVEFSSPREREWLAKAHGTFIRGYTKAIDEAVWIIHELGTESAK
jgi:hypothetical protein